MTKLKSVEVDLGEFGVVEFREPLFDEVAPHLGSDDIGLRLLRLCAYQEGKRLFDGEVGMSFGMKLMQHVDSAMQVCGMGAGKKELPTESE